MYPEYRDRLKKLPVAVFVDPNARAPPAPAAPAGRGAGPAQRLPEAAAERPPGGRGAGAGGRRQ